MRAGRMWASLVGAIFSLAVLATAAQAAPQASDYTLYNLGAGQVPTGVNASGEVSLNSSGSQPAEVWSDGTVTQLPQLSGDVSGSTDGITDAGVVYGTSDETPARGLVWQSPTSSPTAFSPISATTVDQIAVGAGGQIAFTVGQLQDGYDDAYDSPDGGQTLNQLSQCGDGTVAGSSAGLGANADEVLWDVMCQGASARSYYLAPIDDTNAPTTLDFAACNLASDGTVVGPSADGQSGIMRLPGETDQPLPLVPSCTSGYDGSGSQIVNADHEVLGTAGGADSLYADGTVVAISSLFPADSGWSDEQATAINDAGDIIGTGQYDGTASGFLLQNTALSVHGAEVTEPTSGSVSVPIQVTLSSALSDPVTVDYQTVDGTATVAAGDYDATSGTLTFPPGATSETFDVTVNARATDDVSFGVELSNSTGASLGTSLASVLIIAPTQPPAASLQCAYDFSSTANTCTFLVNGQKSAPTGTVHVTSSGSGHLDETDCSLSPTAVGATSSSCSFQFTPGTTAATLTASYGGDAQNAAASATAEICSDPATGLSACAPDPGVIQACIAFYVPSCQAVLDSADVPEICAAAFEDCGGGQASSPGTIDMSGFPQTISTPVSCAQGSGGAQDQWSARPADHSPANPDLKCQIDATLTGKGDALTGAAVQYEANYEEFLGAVAQDQAALTATIFQFCQIQSSGTPAGSCQLLAALGLKVNGLNTTLHRAWGRRGVPIPTYEPGNALDAQAICASLAEENETRYCIAFISSVNETLKAGQLKLSALKHALGVDEPGPADTSSDFKLRRLGPNAATAAARHARFRPRIFALAAGRLTLAEGHKGTLKLHFTKALLQALRLARRHGVKKLHVVFTLTVENRVTTSRTVRVGLTLYLVHPPRHKRKSKHHAH